MTSKTNDFQHVLAEVDRMPVKQRQHIVDVCEEDERFVIKADDFATDDDFRRAVVAEFMRLLAL